MTVVNFIGGVAMVLGALLIAAGGLWPGLAGIVLGALVAGMDWRKQ